MKQKVSVQIQGPNHPRIGLHRNRITPEQAPYQPRTDPEQAPIRPRTGHLGTRPKGGRAHEPRSQAEFVAPPREAGIAKKSKTLQSMSCAVVCQIHDCMRYIVRLLNDQINLV